MIDIHELSEEDKEAYEATFEDENGELPEKISSSAETTSTCMVFAMFETFMMVLCYSILFLCKSIFYSHTDNPITSYYILSAFAIASSMAPTI